MALQIIILAAGQGKRMFSTLPKVLHPLAGKPMLQWVIETARQLNPDAIHVIYGPNGEEMKKALANLGVNWIFQAKQLGTGHAVNQALPHIPEQSQVLILSGDVPLIQASTLHALMDSSSTARTSLNLLVANLDNPSGLGRILRNDSGEIRAIIEEKDATARQKQIKEIYSGICCARASDLARWLPQINAHNAQGEYYLTDIIALAVSENLPILSLQVPDSLEIQGVNNRLQLQQLERLWQKRIAEQLMLAGVTLADASRFDVRGEMKCAEDVFIDINVICVGKVCIGKGCRIGPNCVLRDVTLGENCEILANSVLEDCVIASHCQIGPFARLRPGTKLSENCKIGNFVETKQAQLDTGTKANHLSYLGNVTIGKNVNIGAGTITCNYDGANKHQTIIEDGVFVGSDTQFVAPVSVGAHATIGAGSTIRSDVPAGELTVTVSEQKTIYGWKRPTQK